jgi:hypothetical protein
MYFSTKLVHLLHSFKFDFLFEWIILFKEVKVENVYNLLSASTTQICDTDNI